MHNIVDIDLGDKVQSRSNHEASFKGKLLFADFFPRLEYVEKINEAEKNHIDWAKRTGLCRSAKDVQLLEKARFAGSFISSLTHDVRDMELMANYMIWVFVFDDALEYFYEGKKLKDKELYLEEEIRILEEITATKRLP